MNCQPTTITNRKRQLLIYIILGTWELHRLMLLFAIKGSSSKLQFQQHREKQPSFLYCLLCDQISLWSCQIGSLWKEDIYWSNLLILVSLKADFDTYWFSSSHFCSPCKVKGYFEPCVSPRWSIACPLEHWPFCL